MIAKINSYLCSRLLLRFFERWQDIVELDSSI